jgi:monofunctional biosynthetic peptidoglycan transglycosylase
MPAGRRTLLRRSLPLAALVLGLLAVAVVALWITLPDPASLARTNPRTTAVIEQRRAEARARGRTLRVRQAWVGLDRISPRMLDAVILSEDANFFGHEGIDWDAVRLAAEHDLKKGGFARGASTITQQLAKNLWLGTEKHLVRKVKEAILAAKLERALSKRRILALYLNVAETGEGVFGVEAGARARFGTSAAALTAAQAAVLASLLPAPRRVDLSHPTTWLKRRARRLLDRMHGAGRLSADEHRRASTELERLLAGPRPADDSGDEEPPADDEPAVAERPAPAVQLETAALERETLAPSTEPTSGPEAIPTPPASDPTSAPAPDPAPTSGPGDPDLGTGGATDALRR